MIIYENNLHEKLLGLAISRDYLKYNTPFCDMVDDPYWALDIDLALNYNSALNGDLDAATKFVQDLTLNSSVLDNSTIEFYVQKITYNPAFKSAIREMRSRFATPNLYNDDFQSLLLNALKDCLNSPCNLFTETSDSIGRLMQNASNQTNSNTFGVGSLSATFTNMLNGLGEDVFQKLPAVFSNGYTEVVQASSQAFNKAQAVLAGKENLTTFNQKIGGGQSLRDPATVFRYTPNIRSSYDYSVASSNALAKVRESLGGCFSRFEYNFRRNPYNRGDNQKAPAGNTIANINGDTVEQNATGEIVRRRKTNTSKRNALTSVLPSDKLEKDTGVGIDVSSKIYTLQSSGPNDYTIFGAYVDKTGKTIYNDTYNATPNDLKTLGGENNMGPDFPYAPSLPAKTDAGRKSLDTGTMSEVVRKDNSGTVAQYYADGWDHDLSRESMETIYKKSEGSTTYNDGVAISAGLLADYLDRSDELINTTRKERAAFIRSTSLVDFQRANQAFVGVKRSGAPEDVESSWKFYKIVDVNLQQNLNVDFTLGAWQFFLQEFFGKSMSSTGKEKLGGTNWSVLKKISQDEIKEPLDFIVVRGDLETVKGVMFGGATLREGEIATIDDAVGAGDTLLPNIDNLPQEKADAPAAPSPLTLDELLQLKNLTPDQEKRLNRLLEEQNRNLPPGPPL